MPHVWHETVTPLKNGNGADGSAADEIAALTTNNPQSANAKGKDDGFIAAIRAQFSCETAEHKGEPWPGHRFGTNFHKRSRCGQSGVRPCASDSLR
jgi:hypothetical protein